jgi:hypothetical protein
LTLVRHGAEVCRDSFYDSNVPRGERVAGADVIAQRDGEGAHGPHKAEDQIAPHEPLASRALKAEREYGSRESWEEHEERSDRNEDEAQRGEPPMSITRLRHVEDFLEPHAPHTL